MRVCAGYALAFALVALTGCGGSGDPLAATTKAASTTLATSASTQTAFAGAALFGSTPGPPAARGLFDFGGGVGYEAISVDHRPGRPPRTLYLDFVKGSAVYLHPDVGGRSVVPGIRNWLEIELAQTRPGLALEAAALDPTFLLDEIAWGATSARSLGHAVLSHLPTAKYDVTVSIPRARSAASGAGARRVLTEELAALAGRPPRVEMSIWVNGPGQVVRIVTSIPGAEAGTITTDLSGFGAHIIPNLPSASLRENVTTAVPPGTSPWTLATTGSST